MLALPVPAPSAPSAGGRIVAVDGRPLPFRGGSLAVDACGGLARVTLRQVFRNPWPDPLRVSYQLPLPPDGVVGGFAFELDGERVVGEIDRRAAARERFEEALVEGRTAALLEEERAGLFAQEVGNVPPGGEVVCELVIDQRLVWREGGWEWRFPTVVAPRYLGEAGRVAQAERVEVDVAEGDLPARLSLELRVRDALSGPVRSPSHAVVARTAGGATEVGLAAGGGAALDRDVVVRWPVATPAPGVTLDVANAGGRACALVTVVPPAVAAASACRRDLVVLLDTSGSMEGEPLAQAREVVIALVESLREPDTLELIEFSTRARRWKDRPVAATPAARAQAMAWLRKLQAGGGTEMRDGIEAALAGLGGEAQRQVILVTDGLIGFEREIVAAVRTRLPRGSRVHTLGIGSAVNRGLLAPVARAGAGVEAVVGLGEDPSQAAALLLAATAAPQVVNLEVGGPGLVAAPARLPDVMAGRPARFVLEVRPVGGEIQLRGATATGTWGTTLAVPPTAPGQGSGSVPRLYAREAVDELEVAAAAGEAVDAAIEALGLGFGIPTRLTSWVAVSRAVKVDPAAPTRHERVPQALPHGMSVEALGLRAAAPLSLSLGSLQAPARWMGRAALRPEVFRMVVAEPQPPRPACAPASRDAADEEISGSAGRVRAPAAMRLRGRLLSRGAARWVVEVEVDGPFTWDRPAEAVLRLSDGRRVVAPLDLRSTTASARLDAGQRLRFVLRVPTPLGSDPALIELTLPDGRQLLVDVAS